VTLSLRTRSRRWAV